MKPTEKDFYREESVLPRSLKWPLLRQRPKDVHVILRGHHHQLLYIGWRAGWGALVCCWLTHLDDEAIEARGRREQEQPGWRTSLHTEAMRDAAWSKGPCAWSCLDARISTQNRDLPLNHIKGLVLSMMHMPGGGRTRGDDVFNKGVGPPVCSPVAFTCVSTPKNQRTCPASLIDTYG
jgi:hypothetical protein